MLEGAERLDETAEVCARSLEHERANPSVTDEGLVYALAEPISCLRAAGLDPVPGDP
ncbi:MAG: hypothetical protein KC501_02255 [Myxococcales bacterium]|nr:hypothetical protein [Myxococcales bacterium]